MIVLAAGSIIYTTTVRWSHGLALDNLGRGVILIVCAGLLNAALGWYLLRIGRRNHSLILEADGKHVLTDSWTSFGVVAGLALVMATGWKPFDPLIAYAVAANILFTGGRLLWRSINGLLDYSDPRVGHKIRHGSTPFARNLGSNITECASGPLVIGSSSRFTFCFPTRCASAMLTGWLPKWKSETRDLEMPAEVTTHLESLEDHAEVHHSEHYTDGRISSACC